MSTRPEQEWLATDRDRIADERDRLAHERDQTAHLRDLLADERDRVANARDVAADQRDRIADERVNAAEHEVAGLRTAMDTRGVIEQAKGMVMLTLKVDAEAAFDVLVQRSQTSHRKLVEVAQEVVATGIRPVE